MTLRYVHKPSQEGTILTSGGLSADDQAAVELLVLRYLKKRLPVGCQQLSVRVEVDFFLETPLLNGDWKESVPVVVARPTSASERLEVATQQGQGYRVVEAEDGSWEIRDFVCPHCQRQYTDRRAITTGACLVAYWKLHAEVVRVRLQQNPSPEGQRDG
jgi:hypothetical protein